MQRQNTTNANPGQNFWLVNNGPMQSSVWKDNNSAAGSQLDPARSRLGTEKWGRESGGAPWGSTSNEGVAASGISSGASTTTNVNEQLQQMYPHHVQTDNWQIKETSPFRPISSKPESTVETTDFSHKPAHSNIEAEDTEKSSQSGGSPVDQGSSGKKAVADNVVQPHNVMSGGEINTPSTSSSAVSTDKTNEDDSSKKAASDASSEMRSRTDTSSVSGGVQVVQVTNPQQNYYQAAVVGMSSVAGPTVMTTTSVPTSSGPTSTSEPSNTVGDLQEAMQALNMESYVAQQQQPQNVAAIGTYQLAMQQHPLPGQQQQIMAGMYHSYVMPQAGYADPNTLAQFPMMPQYYSGWPQHVYPVVLPQHLSAATGGGNATAATSSSSSGSTAGVNHTSVSAGGTTDTATATDQSRSDTPASQSQETNTGSASTSDNSGTAVLPNVAAMQPTNNFNIPFAAGYPPFIPSAYYDQTGALIINNGRAGGPMRLFAPHMIMNGSQPLVMPPQPGTNGSMFRFGTQQQAATNAALYTSQQQQAAAAMQGSSQSSSHPNSHNSAAHNPSSYSTAQTGNYSNSGLLTLNMGSTSSTPQRRDSFSDFSKHSAYGAGSAVSGQQQQGGPTSNMPNLYNSILSPNAAGSGLSGVSPSPAPLGSMMSSHLKSPPPMSSSSYMGSRNNNRLFSAAPGSEPGGRYRNSSVSSSLYAAGSSGTFNIYGGNRSGRTSAAGGSGGATGSGGGSGVSPGRSKLLDDFRNNRLPNPQLNELVNHIVEFSQDQHGSRFIQQKLERATPSEKQRVFNEINVSAYQLMTDVFGNYVIQKFFEFGSREQKQELASRIHGRVLPLALQMYGCRVIQKALECIQQDQQVEIVKELNGHLLKCVKDQNGNHVVQKCIECVPPVHLQFIVDGFHGQVCGLSSHPYGCRVMQRILEHCTDEQTTPILDELLQHTETLVKDQYGNYVIQHILEHGRIDNKNQIVAELRGKILLLSQHKFASNVIEKCVSHASPDSRALLIKEVCDEPDALFIMMKDQYANYVVQKMIDISDQQQKKNLINKIRPHAINLRKFTYGKHIITKLDKFFSKSTNTTSSNSNSASPGPGTSGGPGSSTNVSPTMFNEVQPPPPVIVGGGGDNEIAEALGVSASSFPVVVSNPTSWAPSPSQMAGASLTGSERRSSPESDS